MEFRIPARFAARLTERLLEQLLRRAILHASILRQMEGDGLPAEEDEERFAYPERAAQHLHRGLSPARADIAPIR